MATAKIQPDEYEEFGRFLEDACGIVLGKNKHYLVTSRLQRLMKDTQFNSLSDVLEELRRNRNGALRTRLIDAMTTNETLWFRDIYPFEVLTNQIFPELAEKKITSPRIWSAACSSGQEAYSICIAYREFLTTRPGAFPGQLEVIGTDISPTVLQEAKDGIYESIAVARGLSEERRKRFFREVGGRYEALDEIRRYTEFRDLNLMQNYSMLGKFDIIFIRNVLIYFSSDLKRDILGRASKLLNPAGYLFLGSSESIAKYSDAFEMIRCKPGVVYRLKS